MKKVAIGLVFCIMQLCLGQAFAQEENHLGLYFDPFGDLDCIEADTLSAYAPLSLYVILKSPTFEELYGYEFGMEIEGPILVAGLEFPEGYPCINVGGEGQYIVGLSIPMPMAASNILLTFDLIYMSTSNEGVCFTLSGSVPSSLNPLYPAFTFSGDGLVSGTVNNGIEGDCTARISETPCGVVATDSHNWDSLKSLYR